MTPRMSLPTTIGKPKAPCRPSRAAARARGKLASLTTSGIQAGWPLAQTRPGSPTPGANVVCRHQGHEFLHRGRRGVPQVAAAQHVGLRVDPPHGAHFDQPRLSQIASQDLGHGVVELGRLRQDAARPCTGRPGAAPPADARGPCGSSDAAFHQISAVKITMLATHEQRQPHDRVEHAPLLGQQPAHPPDGRGDQDRRRAAAAAPWRRRRRGW